MSPIVLLGLSESEGLYHFKAFLKVYINGGVGDCDCDCFSSSHLGNEKDLDAFIHISGRFLI